jgi:serine/arginine repetitive matrix protein 2
MPIRSRAQSQDQLRTLSAQLQTSPQRDSMPTIRLISAAPTAAGSAPGLGDPFIDTSFSSPSVTASPPTPLAPKNDSQAPRKRLVPRKSKLGLLVSGKRSKTPENNDLSDVVRRVGVNAPTDSVAKSGFEIYVDPTAQPEVGEVLMVKKKKSRAALSALKWGTLAEVTNSAPSKDSTRGAKLKNEEKEKWWSIGRGRKDSKDMKIIEKENLRTDRMFPHHYCKLRLFMLHFVQLLESPWKLWHPEHASVP